MKRLSTICACIACLSLTIACSQAGKPEAGTTRKQGFAADAGVPRCESQGRVAGEDRGCTKDSECATVVLDCSNCRCSAVRTTELARYKEPSCEGKQRAVCDDDCRPEYKSEAPRCVAGCCSSVRLK
jgi:hypothetical protein